MGSRTKEISIWEGYGEGRGKMGGRDGGRGELTISHSDERWCPGCYGVREKNYFSGKTMCPRGGGGAGRTNLGICNSIPAREKLSWELFRSVLFFFCVVFFS